MEYLTIDIQTSWRADIFKLLNEIWLNRACQVINGHCLNSREFAEHYQCYAMNIVLLTINVLTDNDAFIHKSIRHYTLNYQTVNCSIFLIVLNGAFIKGFFCYKSKRFI